MTLHQETLATEGLKKLEPAADKRRPVEWKPAKAKPVGPMTYSVSKGRTYSGQLDKLARRSILTAI
jgi:hypothetical protein